MKEKTGVKNYLAAFVAAVALIALHGIGIPFAADYAVMIDAGSSGSRVHIFEWTPGRDNALPKVKTIKPGPNECEKSSVNPGIAQKAPESAEDAGNYLRPLIACAEGVIKDEKARHNTRLYLMATAGMRLLDRQSQESIIGAVRAYLKKETPFIVDTRSIRTISGEEEGAFGWISANYSYDDPTAPVFLGDKGTLDLGGASTQMTFRSLNAPRNNGFTVTLGDTLYNLYAASFLGWGQNEAFRKTPGHACLPSGYTKESKGDYDTCKESILASMTAEGNNKCNGPCSPASGCKPPAEGAFVAFSGYYYTYSFFFPGTDRVSLSLLEKEGRTFCRTPWKELVTLHPRTAEQFLSRYCFNAAYMTALLNSAYGFPMDTDRISVRKDADWTLGAMVYEAARTRR
ncbi:MAG: hypothetical protein HY880_06765 [Deltaproteobacteria bacterium]|nr:hypothetical protein [Deltaproteobacteria bacterium]